MMMTMTLMLVLQYGDFSFRLNDYLVLLETRPTKNLKQVSVGMVCNNESKHRPWSIGYGWPACPNLLGRRCCPYHGDEMTYLHPHPHPHPHHHHDIVRPPPPESVLE